jgi:acid stress chaperone HdeB
MIRLLNASLAALVGLATMVQAEVIDLATVKCSDMQSMSNEDGAYLFVWLHGYYGGQAGDTTMDLKAMEASGQAIGEYCASNPEVGVLSAVQQALGGQ